MKLVAFEEWFATRIDHQDGELWPGKLSYHPVKGISLDTIQFDEWTGEPRTFQSDTITGYVDYRTPCTLVQPFIQSTNLGGSGISRTRYNVVLQGMIKNIHLADLDAPAFLGFRMSSDNVHRYLSPNLVRRQWRKAKGTIVPEVEISDPVTQEFAFSDGTRVVLYSNSSVSLSLDETPVRQFTSLEVAFPTPVTYGDVTYRIGVVEALFAFLIGGRLSTSVYTLLLPSGTGGPDVAVRDAELWLVPAHASEDVREATPWAMSTAGRSSVGTGDLLELCLVRDERDLLYYMYVVATVEAGLLAVDAAYVELLGCLENFDRQEFGSGGNPGLRAARRRIQAIVDLHAGEGDRQVCREIGQRVRNEFGLRQRLGRLVDVWRGAAFRGDPDLTKVVAHRNLKPHGRGSQVDVQAFRYMIAILPFLTALLRFHLLSKIGYDRVGIARAFSSRPYRYGSFVPRDLVPGSMAMNQASIGGDVSPTSNGDEGVAGPWGVA